MNNQRVFHRFLTIIGLMMLFSNNAKGQAMTDRILKRDNTVLFVTVLGEQMDSIAYQLFEQKEASVFYVPKTEVDKLVLKNGRTFSYVRNYQGPKQADVVERTEVPFSTKRHAIKVTPFAFYLGYTNFVLERKTKPRQSVELKLSLIGLGRPQSSIQERGAYTSIGYKFMSNRIENMSRPPRHSLQGSYLRPELLIGRYAHPFSHETYQGNDLVKVKDQLNITYGCLLLNVGKQWVLSLLTLDVFATVGYGAYQQSDNGIGIVRTTRYGNRLDMTGKNGSGLTEFKVGLYVGSLF